MKVSRPTRIVRFFTATTALFALLTTTLVEAQQRTPKPAVRLATSEATIQPNQPTLQEPGEAPEEILSDPSAKPLTDSKLPASGDAMVLAAHSRSRESRTVADYTAMLTLCQEGIRAGVSSDTDRFAKRLMSWAYNRRGELLSEQGHATVALADFEAAVRNDPTRWRALHNRAVSYAEMGRYDQAIADFNQTIEINPQYVNAYFNRGELRYEMGQYEAAIQDYTKAIKLDSTDTATYNSRGHAYYRTGKFRQAVHDFTMAIRLDAKNAGAFTNRGDLYADLGFYERAVRDYQQAVRLDPNLSRAYLSAAWLMATCPDAKFRSTDGALQAIGKAESQGSKSDHRYLDILAASHANAGDFAKAQAVVQRAIHLAPPKLSTAYKQRLEYYEHHQPFRAKPRKIDLPAEEQTSVLKRPN